MDQSSHVNKKLVVGRKEKQESLDLIERKNGAAIAIAIALCCSTVYSVPC